MQIQSPNFSFLDDNLAIFAVRAERYVFDDANTAFIKLRQFAELIARHTAARHGFETCEDDLRNTIQLLKKHRLIPQEVHELLELLRLWGNDANHEGKDDRQGALAALINAHRIAIWYHRTFVDEHLVQGPFRPPPNPVSPDDDLLREVKQLREVAAQYKQQIEEAGDFKRVMHELEVEASQYQAHLKLIVQQKQIDVLQLENQLRELRAEALAKAPAQLRLLVDRSQFAARAIGLRGDSAQYIPLTQVRVKGPLSECCKGTTLLARTGDYGYISQYCARCGKQMTVKQKHFDNLDLWVDCPRGHGRMSEKRVRMKGPTGSDMYNYGFGCNVCYWRCSLASLLPDESELAF